MGTSEKIKNELKTLLDEQKDLFELAKDWENFIQFGTAYQVWYSRACKVVEVLGNERLEEFTSYYQISKQRSPSIKGSSIYNYVIQDYINGWHLPSSKDDKSKKYENRIVRQKIINQLQILKSLESRIDNVLQDVRGHLLADIQDSELKAAEQLRKVNLRAAGAVAGVVLEGHLQRVTQSHNISIRKKSPTIADLNDPLKSKGVYDTPTWRKIQLLADIRNLCSHKKDREPTDAEVVELISGVNWVIKSVF